LIRFGSIIQRCLTTPTVELVISCRLQLLCEAKNDQLHDPWWLVNTQWFASRFG